MKDIYELMSEKKLVPVVILEHAADAVPLAEALERGGLPLAEITLRTPEALESIRRIRNEVPGVMVGAGTVITVEDALAAIKSGAEFIVSPGLNPRVVKLCRERNIPVIPGVTTATEMQTAIELGLDKLKFFPAMAPGALEYLKALGSIFPSLKFMPTGGINKENMGDYLKLDNIFCCGGSWLCPKKLINEGRFEAVTELCREAEETARSF